MTPLHSSPAENLLSRLDGVRQTKPGQWAARCPAHEDRHPSLRIRERADGALLIKCFTGCETGTVVRSVGLELRDLFPPPPADHFRGPAPLTERPYVAVREFAALLAHESLVTVLAAEQMARGEPLSAHDHERLVSAAATIRRAREVL